MSDKERISELAKRLSSSGYFAKGGKIHIKPSHRGKLTELSPVIVTPDKDYTIFLNSLPDNQRFTPESEYSTRRYWELNGRPKNFEEAKKLGMYTLDSSDGLYHANSIAWGEDGIGYFMKPKHHDTLKYELDWYKNGLITEEGGKQRQMNKNERAEWEEFRRLYDLDTSGDFFRYVPKYASGGKIHIKPSHRGRLTELKERTGKSEAELYNDGNPAHKKMVVFARNTRKWKHGDGGLLRQYPGGGNMVGQFAFVPGAFSLSNMFQEVGERISNAVTGRKQYADTAPASLPGHMKSDDSVSLQNILLDSGYDIGSAEPDGYFGKKSTRALQQMLVDSGYDLGTTGEAGNGVDGIVGKRTRAAYQSWLDNGAYIKRAPGSLLRRSSADEGKTDNQQPDSTASVYSPAPQQGDTTVYSGPYNYGQHYDDRFQNFITSTGLDLSNIPTEDVPDNPHTDTFSPFIFDNLSQCNQNSARNTLECAAHITYLNLDDKRGFNIDRNGIRGNAWTMGDNMVDAGGYRLFDLFAGEGAPSGRWADGNKQRTIDYVRQQANDPQYADYLSHTLQPGDVVELLYPNSNQFQKAWTNTGGRRQNTHIGYVVQIGDELYIRDNIGNHHTNTSRVNTRRLSSVLSGKERDGVLITGAVRARDALGDRTLVGGRQGRDLSAFGITPSGVDNASQSRLSNDAAYRAMGAIYRNREQVLNDNNLTVDEFNRLAGLTQAILFKESASGELFHNNKWVAKSSQLPGVVNDANQGDARSVRAFGYAVGTPLSYLASDLTGGLTSYISSHAEPSAGLGSVKYVGPESPLTDRQRQQLGDSAQIKLALRSAQPEASGVITFYALSSAMHRVQYMLHRYAPARIANDPNIVDQLTALAHNQGTDMIEQTLLNAKADGDWEGHMQGLLAATYGANAMLVRSYNNTNMFSPSDKRRLDTARQQRIDDAVARIMERGLTVEDVANMVAQRASTYVASATRYILPK